MATIRSGRAVLLALILVLAACSSTDGGTETADAASATTEADTGLDETTVVDATDEVEDVEAEVEAGTEEAPAADERAEAPAEPATYDPDGTQLTEQFVPIDAGTYRVDTVGTPFSFTIPPDESFHIQPNSNAHFVISDLTSQGPDDRDLVFLRASALADPTAPNAPVEDQGDGWPANDIEGWLDAVVDDVVVSDRQTVMLGDTPALRFDLQLADDAECSPDGFCVGFATNRLINGIALNPGHFYRIWWVDQGTEAPLVISAGKIREGSWFETAESLMATVAFGEAEPNPIPAEGDLWTLGFSSDVPVGTIEVPALGGVRFEVGTETFLIQEQSVGWNALQVPGGGPADSEFFFADRTHGDWEPIETIEDVLAAFDANNVEYTEVTSTTVAGFDARVFDMASGGGFSPILVAPEDPGGEGGWSPPQEGRIWIAETDRGVLVVTAEIFESFGDLDAVIAQSELLVETLEFIELG